jgi:8-oxo-dGTP pyrophosphatase MutT (NUDIX family)
MNTHVIKTYSAEPAHPICLHENRHFRMMFNGQFHYLDGLPYPRSVIVIPRFSNGDLQLVKLPRAPKIGLSWEFPRGGLEGAETAIEGGLRELGEETGYADIAPEHARYVGRLAPDTATINSIADVVLVDIPDDAVQGGFDTREILQPIRVPEHEFRHHIRSGDIVDGQTVGAYTLLLLETKVLH